MKKAIVVVYGKDRLGIVYNVTKILYDNNINVLDIRQTTIDGNINMMAIVDVTRVKELGKIKELLSKYGKKSCLDINFQLEDAFISMHSL